jgi:hypothetical protein
MATQDEVPFGFMHRNTTDCQRTKITCLLNPCVSDEMKCLSGSCTLMHDSSVHSECLSV